jgi:hypothetical protein
MTRSLACLAIVRWRVAALFKRRANAFHDDVMNFGTLLKGGFAQSLIDCFGQVNAGMDDIRSRPAAGGLPGGTGDL